jgi:hypothetical protein
MEPKYFVSSNVVKMRCIIFELKNIMIPLDKYFPSVQKFCNPDGTALYGPVPEDINSILRRNSVIPILYHIFVHLPSGFPWTKLCTIAPEEVTYSLMPPVCVRDYKSFHLAAIPSHIFLSGLDEFYLT